MSKESLEHLRDYIQLTLSPSDISWLADELLLISQKEQQLEPYTIEELEERVMASERQIAEGRFQDFDEALDELEAEFAEEDKRMTETVESNRIRRCHAPDSPDGQVHPEGVRQKQPRQVHAGCPPDKTVAGR